MITIISKKFPECFPEGFRDKLLTFGAKEQELNVYRICKFGIINEEAFVGSVEESLRRGKKKENFLSLMTLVIILHLVI